MKELINSQKNRKVLISRTLFSDGYNYYMTVFAYNKYLNFWFINENYKQSDTILSFKKAIDKAKKIINP
jgi:hypothetical protein